MSLFGLDNKMSLNVKKGKDSQSLSAINHIMFYQCRTGGNEL